MAASADEFAAACALALLLHEVVATKRHPAGAARVVWPRVVRGPDW